MSTHRSTLARILLVTVGGLVLVAGSAVGSYLALGRLMPVQKKDSLSVVPAVQAAKPTVAASTAAQTYPLTAKIQFANDVRFGALAATDGWVEGERAQGMVRYSQTSTGAKISMGISTVDPVQKDDQRQTDWVLNNSLYSATKINSSDNAATEVSHDTVNVPTADSAGIEMARVVYSFNKSDGEYTATYVIRQAGSVLLMFSYTAKSSPTYADAAKKFIDNLKIEGKVTYVSTQQ